MEYYSKIGGFWSQFSHLVSLDHVVLLSFISFISSFIFPWCVTLSMLPGADKFNMRQILAPLRREPKKQKSQQVDFWLKKGGRLSCLHSGEISRAAAGTSETVHEADATAT